MSEARVIEGVTEDVEAKMLACEANVCAEDGMLLKTCEHGIRHPVGHLHRRLVDSDFQRRHETKGKYFSDHAQCDGCCGFHVETLAV